MEINKSDILIHFELNRRIKAIGNCYYTLSNQLLMSLDLTLSQCEILLYLYKMPEERVETDRLLNMMQIAPSSLSNILKKMKRKGYIRYSNEGNDMRKKQVTLTIKAMEIQESVTKKMECLENILYNQLTDLECEEAYRILCKMYQNVSNYMQEDIL